MKTIYKAALVAALLAFGLPVTTQLAWSASNARVAQTQTGTASWYGGQFHGRTTANGETFNMHQLTAAHKSLPFGSRVRITNQANGQSVVVRINDRGPFVGGRVIDLSRAAAVQIGMIQAGTARVLLEILA